MISHLLTQQDFDPDIGAQRVLREKNALGDFRGSVRVQQGTVSRALAEEVFAPEDTSAPAQKDCRLLHPSAVKALSRQIHGRGLVLCQYLLDSGGKLPVFAHRRQSRIDFAGLRLSPVDHRTRPAVVQKGGKAYAAVRAVLTQQHARPSLFRVLHEHIVEKRLLVALAQHLLDIESQPAESPLDHLLCGIVHDGSREHHRGDLLRRDHGLQKGKASAQIQSQKGSGMIVLSLDPDRDILLHFAQQRSHCRSLAFTVSLQCLVSDDPDRGILQLAQSQRNIVGLLPLDRGKSHRFPGDSSRRRVDKTAPEAGPLII